MSNLLSYSQLLRDRELFRQSGTKSGGDFNLLDFPGVKYFKLFFYFNNGDSEGAQNDLASNGLLAPTWMLNVDEKQLYMYNSAWSYLKLNCEDERAELLEKFVSLLSNISSESPWYFSELTGLDAVLERKIMAEKEFKIEENRYKLSIKCLNDSFDDRIGTLLDLYRSIVCSWITKREILPANLRKFDMGILIYETLNISQHKNGNKYSVMGSDNSKEYKASYKYLELHNCEFDYNSSKGNFATINNAEGIQPEYTIDIWFDDCYETRYNEFLLKELGDIIKIDINNHIESPYKNLLDKNPVKNIVDGVDDNKDIDINLLYNPHKTLPGMQGSGRSSLPLENAKNQIVGTAKNILSGLMKKAVLGNLYTFSLTRMGDQFKSLMDGNVWTAARNVSEYVNDAQQRRENNIPITHSLFTTNSKILPTKEYIGNLYKANTIANNL